MHKNLLIVAWFKIYPVIGKHNFIVGDSRSILVRKDPYNIYKIMKRIIAESETR
jgi:hypothetical protein